MAEYILGNPSAQQAIRRQLTLYRQSPERFVTQSHPLFAFVTLAQLVTTPAYAPYLDQSLLREALATLPDALADDHPLSPLDPERVWIGIAAPVSMGGFGGFHRSRAGMLRSF